MKRKFRRHDLVTLVPGARSVMEVEVLGEEKCWPASAVRELKEGHVQGVALPGVVSRQRPGIEGLTLGFSSPTRREGTRLRGRAVVPHRAVALVRDPYQVIALRRCTSVPDLPVFRVLDEVWAAASVEGLVCGVFGSAALQLACGLPYCHEASDVDLIVRLGPLDAVERFHRTVRALAVESGVAIDVEVELPDGAGIKLAELFDDGSTVLAKGFSGVSLMQKNEVRAMDHRQYLV